MKQLAALQHFILLFYISYLIARGVSECVSECVSSRVCSYDSHLGFIISAHEVRYYFQE